MSYLIVQVISFQRGEFPIKSPYEINMYYVICASYCTSCCKDVDLHFQELTIWKRQPGKWIIAKSMINYRSSQRKGVTKMRPFHVKRKKICAKAPDFQNITPAYFLQLYLCFSVSFVGSFSYPLHRRVGVAQGSVLVSLYMYIFTS